MPSKRFHSTRSTVFADSNVACTNMFAPKPEEHMDISVKEAIFDELQRYLVGEIVASVHRGLEDLRLPREKLEDVINSIAFNVCCAIDASTIMEHSGRRVLPVLTFAESADFERVVSSGSTSFMHEYVHGVTDDYLKNVA